MALGGHLAGVHISSSIVTGGLPFGSMASDGGMPGAGGSDGNGAGARRIGDGPNPDGSTDVGGMIIQLELPQDGGSVTSIQTTGIGQLGSVLQNMMQEQLAFARERLRDQASGGAGTGGATVAPAASGTAVGSVGGSAPSAAAADPPSDVPASAARIAQPGPGRGASSAAAEVALPTRVLRLTQQLVSDVRRQQALPQEDRDAEAARLTREYLQQVPDLLRQALPQAAAGVNEFLQRAQGSGRDTAPVATSTATTADAGAQTLPVVADAMSDPIPDPIPELVPEAPVAAVAEAAPASSSRAVADDGKVQPPAEVAEQAPGIRNAVQQPAAGASTSDGADAGTSSGSQSKAGPSLPKRPAPKGLAGGLKVRKPRSSTGAVPGPGPASGPPVASAVAPGAPVMPAAAGGGGGGSPLDALMPLMQSPQMQQMLSSPQVQGMAEQMSSGNADLGSLMQSMMPMVSSMLGGGGAGQDGLGASGPGGRVSRSAGASSSQASSMPPAGSPEMKAVLVQELGAEEAARWQKIIKDDKSLMHQSGKSARQHSSAYAAGSIKDAEGDKGFMF